MKIVLAALAVLALTTGFTCSKNPPVEETPAQDTMAAPAETAPTEMPAEGAPADVTTTTVAPSN